MSDQVRAVSDDETLLRTGYSPLHIQNGCLLPSAISTEDLQRRGFSVDRERLVDLGTIWARTDEHMRRSPDDRKEAWIASFLCSSARAEIYQRDGEPAFRVECEPIEANNAHAAIYSFIQRSKSDIKGIKSLLIPHLNRELRTLECYRAEREQVN